MANTVRKTVVNSFKKYPPVLTVKQVCEILDLGSTKVYSLIRSGEIERIEKSGRHIRVLKEDVIDFLIAHKNLG